MKKTLLFAALALFAAGLAFGGTITVSQPTAGDKVMGSSMQIAWTSSGVAGNFKIQLIRPGGALVGVLLNNIAASPQNLDRRCSGGGRRTVQDPRARPGRLGRRPERDLHRHCRRRRRSRRPG